MGLQTDSLVSATLPAISQGSTDKIHCCDEPSLNRLSGLSTLSICQTVVLINCQAIVVEWNFTFNLDPQCLGTACPLLNKNADLCANAY